MERLVILDVNLQPANGREGVAHRFPDGGMGVHHVHQIVDGAFKIEHRGGFGQNFGGQRADDVDAQNFAVFFVADNFDEPAVIAQNGGFAVAHERKFSDFHRAAGIARLLFSQANRANLRLAVGGVGDAILANLLGWFSGDVRDRDNAFHHGGVGQLRHSGDDVADRIQTFFRGFHVFADVHGAALQFCFGFFQAAIFGERHASDRQQKFFGLQRLLLAVLIGEGNGYAFGVFLYAIDFAAGLNLNVFLFEGFIEFSGNLFVFDRHHAWQSFENRNLGAKRVVDGGKFHADRAGAHYDQRFRNFRQLQNGAVGQNRLVIRLDAGQRTGFAAADHQNVGRFDGGFLAVFFDADFSRTFVAAPALHKFHFIFLE